MLIQPMKSFADSTNVELDVLLGFFSPILPQILISDASFLWLWKCEIEVMRTDSPGGFPVLYLKCGFDNLEILF